MVHNCFQLYISGSLLADLGIFVLVAAVVRNVHVMDCATTFLQIYHVLAESVRVIAESPVEPKIHTSPILKNDIYDSRIIVVS